MGICAPEIKFVAVVVSEAGVVYSQRLRFFESATNDLLAKECMAKRQVLPGDDPAELPGDRQEPTR